MDIEVSIVMAYYNRRPLLLNTLRGLEAQGNTNTEIVLVDDGSSPEHEVFDVPAMFDLNIKLLHIHPKEKIINSKFFPIRLNSCIPYNLGFANASGSKIIMQCPECIHNGNVVQYTKENLGDNDYFVFACYSTDKDVGDRILAGEDPSKAIRPLNHRKPLKNGDNAWYTHSQYNPTMLHFCSAMTKKDLYDLGGFDERYADGLAYEDNELLARINKKHMRIRGVDDPFVIHQHHFSMFTRDKDAMGGMMLVNWRKMKKTESSNFYDVKKYNNIFR